jgi:hypothetical protein
MNRKNNQKEPESITDFGDRQVNKQNFSRTVVLPKTALQNCDCNLEDENLMVNVSLVQQGDEKFIKLTPVCKVQTEEPKGDEENVK